MSLSDFILQNSGIILGSGILGSLVTLLFTRYDSDKKIITEHITKERQLWREEIRSLVVQVNDVYQLEQWDALLGIEARFHVLINPYDDNDQDILRALKKIRNYRNKNESTLNIFNRLVSRLLKHDWERVKSETAFFVTARGLFLAFISVVIIVPLLLIAFNYLFPDHMTLMFIIIIGCILGLPILYELFLTYLDELLSSKSYDFSKFIFWLKNKPYREPDDGLSENIDVTFSEQCNDKETYIVTITKS